MIAAIRSAAIAAWPSEKTPAYVRGFETGATAMLERYVERVGVTVER
jgi:hypothetical protein